MLVFILSLLTVFSWGTWIPVLHKIPFRSESSKNLYITVAHMFMALIIAMFNGGIPGGWAFFLPFLGGIIWSLSAQAALFAVGRIGLARANGIWSPLNILFSILWGIFLFAEFQGLSFGQYLAYLLSFAAIVGGVLLIVFPGSQSKEGKSAGWIGGIVGALTAGFLWGSYFIPIKILDAEIWQTVFPMSLGMLSVPLIMLLVKRTDPRLQNTSHYVRALSSGLLWGIGNYSSLLLMAQIGTGKGFTIAQLALVVNALIGVFLFKTPPAKSVAARWIFIGITISLLGAVYLGNA
jgi:glucose uptake protein